MSEVIEMGLDQSFRFQKNYADMYVEQTIEELKRKLNGHEFYLLTGRKAKIVFVGDKGMFDVRLEAELIDHVEFHITKTGQGGMLEDMNRGETK